MTAAVSYERTREHLEALGLQAALEALDPVLEAGQKQERTTVEVLDELLTRERERELSGAYEDLHGDDVRERLQMAGIRLAAILNEIFPE